MNRIEEIKKRLKEYREHYNDPYAYYHEEISQVRELYQHASDDIAYLVAKIEQLKAENKELKEITKP